MSRIIKVREKSNLYFRWLFDIFCFNSMSSTLDIVQFQIPLKKKERKVL